MWPELGASASRNAGIPIVTVDAIENWRGSSGNMGERTVESHLTKIYRELGIRSRAQLATALSATASIDN